MSLKCIYKAGITPFVTMGMVTG